MGNISSDSFGKSKFTFTNSDLKVWDIIGRSLVVHAKPDNNNSVCSAESDNIGNGFGIIARSSGLLGNTKKVCACDGRTLWNDKQLGVNKNTASTPTPTTTTQAETTTAALFPKSSQEPSSRNDVISSSTPHPFFFSSI